MTTTAIKAAGSQSSNGSAGTGAAAGAQLVPIDTQSGIVLIPQPTALTRLNYYDGKFLRAADLSAEQDYLRNLSALSNRAGGSGVVHGLDVKNAGNGTLTLTSGLAIDPKGKVIWLPYDASVNLAQLIERSREGAASGAGTAARAGGESFGGCTVEGVTGSPPTTGLTGTDLYVITVCWAEALCGESDVYGKLCEDACVTSTDRPFRLEGVVVRALPLSLGAPSCTATWLDARHRRSLVASAWFAAERAELGAAMSGTRLRNGPWCQGAVAATGDCVQLAVVAVTGGAIQFLDEWTARRERIEMPPLRYWQWQLAMRPKAVFLAQLLQFQCQLRDVLTTAPPVDGGNDPCAQQTALLRRAKQLLAEIRQQYGTAAREYGASGEKGAAVDAYRPQFLTSLSDLHHDVGTTLTQLDDVAASRVLIEGGIVELPSAGYLPVAIGPLDVQTQVQRLMGEGVELRVCSVRPDYIPHALEEAQHMERICLLQGLENPENRPKVDILVPDGVVTEAKISVGGIPLQVKFRMEAVEVDWQDPNDTMGDVLTLAGAARAEPLDGGGAAFHFAGRGELAKRPREDGAKPAEPPQNANGTIVGVPQAPQAAQPATGAATGTSKDAATATATATTGFTGEKALASDATMSAKRTSLAGQAVRRLFSRPQVTGTAETQGGVIGMQQSTVPPPPPATASPPQSPPERETADFSPSVWATVRVGGNPWELAIGESVPLHGEFAMSMDDGEDSDLIAVEVMIDADLYRDQGTGGSLTGRARGFAVVRVPGEPTDTNFESVPVTLALQVGTGGAGTLTATLEPGDSRLRIVTQWSARPTSVVSDGDLDWVEQALAQIDDLPAGEQEVARKQIQGDEARHPELRHLPFLRVEALENADVLKSGNAYHERAISALSDLQDLLHEPGFRAAGETRLFAPDRQVQAASTVRATRDWVLFHRRRDNTCDCTCAQDATQVLRRYRFYHVQAPAEATLAQIRAVVAGTAEIEGIETVPVLPRFAADASVVLNSRREVLDAWQEMDLGTEIVYGAVAAAGAGSADPGALLDTRLEALGGVVDDVTPAPRAVYDVLPAMPPSLDAGGVDGVMVIVTQAAVQTHCHRAYALGDQGTMDSAIRMAGAGSGLGDWLANNAFDLGSVRFDDGSTTPRDPLSPLLDAWNARYPQDKPGRAVTVALGSASIPSAAAGEGGAIARALGTTLSDGVRNTRETPGPIGCPFITLFEPAVQAPPIVHQLYRVENANLDGRSVWEEVKGFIAVGQLTQALNAFPDFMLFLGNVIFANGDTTITDGDPVGGWNNTGGGPVEIVGTIHSSSLNPTQIELLRSESKVIAGVVGSPGATPDVVPTDETIQGADGITMLMTPVAITPDEPGTQLDCQTAYLLDPQLSVGVREQADTGAPYDAMALANAAQRGPVTVQFDFGTAGLASDTQSIENGVGTKRLMGYITLVDPNAGEDVLKLAHERSVTIASVIGAGANTVALPPQRAGSAIPGGCGAVTFILQNPG